MSGYIDTSTGEGLWEGYNGGRTGTETGPLVATKWAQWSAVLDQGTCDFCGWMDERFFDTTKVPYDPPMHWGCRCIIAYLSRDEYPPSGLTYGNGPPKASWPPGIKGGMRGGKPTLRNVPPKVKPVDGKVKKWAQNWADRFKHKLSKSGRLQTGRRGGFQTMKSLSVWEQEALLDLTGLGKSEGVSAIMRLDGFIGKWTSSSSRVAKKYGEIMARGNVDDVLSFWNKTYDPFRTITRSQAEDFLKVWDAHQKLAAETLRLSNLSSNGKITIYRGVRAERGTGYANVKSSLAAGDMEQSIGTAFIESWSTDIAAARDFAGPRGMLFKKEIDITDVFAHWQEHSKFVNYMKESEIIWYNWDGTLVPKSARMVGQRLEVEAF